MTPPYTREKLLELGEHPADIDRVLARLGEAAADDELPDPARGVPVNQREDE